MGLVCGAAQFLSRCLIFFYKIKKLVKTLYLFQMKRIFLGILIALCLVSFTQTQAFSGGVLPHLYTGIALAELPNELLQNYTYSYSLDRAAFSAGEEVLVGTALRDFSYLGAATPPTGTHPYVHIEVLDPRMSSNKKVFLFNLTLVQTQANVNNYPLRVKHVTFSYILVGELFEGHYDSSGIPSTYIYTKNSAMVAPATLGNTLVDFKTANSESPFLYDPNNAAYRGCGASKRNGNWILETANCTVITATLFITGFEMPISDGSNTLKISTTTTTSISGATILTALGETQIDLKGATASFTADSTRDGLSLKLPVTPLYFYQIMTLVVGIVEYTQGVYPIQGTFMNTFDANSYVEVPADTFVLGTPKTIVYSEVATDPHPKPYYLGYQSSKYGNRICGINYLSIPTPGTVFTPTLSTDAMGFQLSTPEPNPNFDIAAPTATFSAKTPTTTPVTNNRLTTFDAGLSCVFLVSDNPCVEKSTPVAISSPTVQITPSAATPVATVTFTSAAPTGTPYATSGDPNLLSPVTIFSQQSTTTEASTIVYSTTVAASDVKAGVYEGVLHVSFPAPPLTTTKYTIKIEVFGNVVVDQAGEFTNGAPTFKYYHFGFLNSNLSNNTIFITFNFAAGSGALGSQSLEFGLVSHSKVITPNQTCASTCDTLAGYSTGIDYSSVPPNCINCDTSLNLVFDPATGTCACASGYYSTSNGCQPCTVSLCGVCTTDSTSCSACVPNARFVSPTDPKQGCVCNNGFYKSGSQCLPCAPGCATCTKPLECTTCVANSNTRLSPSLNCGCVNGTYEVNTPVCPACSAECLTCSVSAINCTSCNTTGNFNLTGTTCQCINGYYLAIVGTVPQCLKCHFSCANCTGDAANCISCKSAQWTKVGSGCVCNKVLQFVYYANLTMEGVCVDQKCFDINPQCTECTIVALTGVNICKKCNQLGNWTLASDNLTCVCKPGFLNVSGTCVPCGSGCLTCNPVTTCSQCAIGAARISTSSCACPPGTYLTDAFGPLQCLPCAPNCGECQISSTVCTRCINGFSTVNFTCVCPPNKFSPDGVNCVSCGVGCNICLNSTACSSCGNGYILSGGLCLLNCPIGTYNGGDQCFPCSDGCRSCNSDIDCRSCNTGLYLYLGSCRPSCPVGTFAFSNSLCVACSQSCASCSGSPTNCLSCANSLVLNGNQCQTGCAPGTYFNGVQCTACSSPCVTCDGSATTCTQCPSGMYLYRGACSATCPTAVVNGVCTNICPDGSYLSGTTCQRCSTSCNTCSAANVCTSCKGALINYRGTCIASCPQNTIAASGSCLDCDPNCAGCSGSTTSCLNCVSGTYRLAERCYTSCPLSYYPDFASLTCKKCDANCKTCSGPGQCTSCLDNSNPVGGLCAASCGSNCLECQGATCTRCASNYFWNGQSCQLFCPSGSAPSNGVCVCPSGQFLNLGSCVSNCPAEFVKVNNQCESCANPCRTCSTSTTSCDSCIDGYTLDPVNRKCSRSSACNFGQYASSFGDCRYICPESTYYLDSACYVGRCPVGYTADDRNRVCVVSTLPSGCNTPLFLQGTNCVSNCDAGFYPDTTTRVCKPCSANCAACSGPSVCTSCNPGSTLTNNLCVIQPDACPPGQQRYNDICVSGCPVGTFNKDGFCTRLCVAGLYFWNSGCYEGCPTDLRTAEACVVVCPVGYRREGNVCVSGSTQSCNAGQYFNSAIGACDNCRSPCLSCSGSATFCTTCPNNFVLTNGVCYNANSCAAGSYPSPTGCQRCAAKCATCTDLNTCSSCASGYTNTGADCVQTPSTLTPVTLTNLATVKNAQGNIVYIQTEATPFLNNAPTSIYSQFYLFVPSISNPATQVNIWAQDNYIYVALTHPGPIPSYTATLILNSNVLDQLYRSMGYSTSNSFLQVDISSAIPTAPININIPPTAANAKTFSVKTMSQIYNSVLNSITTRAVRQVDNTSTLK